MLIVDTVSAAGTPLWLIILTSGGIIALGTVLGTLLGNLLIGWQTAKREDRRWHREDQMRQAQWNREDAERRERWQYEDKERHERWAREDMLRTFEHRRAAYTDFYVSSGRLATRFFNLSRATDEERGRLQETVLMEAGDLLQVVRLYGTPEATNAAVQISHYLIDWFVFLTRESDLEWAEEDADLSEGKMAEFYRRTADFMAKVRVDMGIKEDHVATG